MSVRDTPDTTNPAGLDAGAPPRNLRERLLSWIVRRALWVVVAVTALTAGAGYLATTLPLVTDFSLLIPDDSRSVREQRRAEGMLGNSSLVAIVLDAPALPPNAAMVADDSVRQAADLLAERLRTDAEFTQVLHRFDRAFFEDHALLYLTVEQLDDLYARLDRRIQAEVMKHNPLYIDLGDDEDDDGQEANEPDIFDPDTLRQLYGGSERDTLEAREYLRDDAGRTYLVLAQPRHPAVDMDYNREIHERVDAHVDALQLEQRFGVTATSVGNYRSALEENQSVRRDLGISGLISLGLLLLLIAFYFRRLWAVIIVFVPLLSGVVIMMGYVRLSVGRLNTITGFCFALFMGLSIDFAIHMLARYDEERGHGRSVLQALSLAYRETGRAALAAGLTTAAGFLSLIAADFRGLEEFGIIAGGGIIICLGVIAIEFPALIALGVRFSSDKSFAVFRRDRDRAPSSRNAFAILSLGAIVLVGLTTVADRVQWQDDFRELRGGSAEALTVMERARAIMGRSTQPAVRIVESMDEARALGAACKAEKERRGRASTVQLCLSMADFVPEEQEPKLERIARITGLLTDKRLEALEPEPRQRLERLRDRAPTKPLTVADLPSEIRANFMAIDERHYLVKAYPIVQTWLLSSNVAFADELLAIDDAVDSDVGPIGAAMVMADLMRVIARDAVLVGTIALSAVFLVLLFIFRSLPRVLTCYLPLIAGLVACAGLMVLMDMKLGFFNMVVIPSLIGIGIDSNIHLVHRYHAEGRGSWPYVVHTTGSGCVMAAITTMAGFAGLLFAGHPGLQSIGTLAVLGITTCTLVSLTVLPAALSWLEALTSRSAFGLLPGHVFRAPSRQESRS